MIKNNPQISGTECYVERNTRKSQRLDKENKLIQACLIGKEIRKNHQKGLGIKAQVWVIRRMILDVRFA